jgi:exopolyphosphatase/guanosine-5'-triphosphate,3'-diphosphate pyrophosphatase
VIDPRDVAAVEAQLGREPRAIHDIGHRCPCGNPDVVTTEPRLPNGTPFPTTFYLTCPRAASRIGTLEGSGLMKEMQDRLADDPDLAAAYRRAHERYLEYRATLGVVEEIEGISAGGMPDRVKCLHVLAGQALAMGRGVNPLGDEVLDLLGPWWETGPCVVVDAGPVAAIDCGTNTIKLLIGDLPDVAVREMRMVRLGQDLDRTGRMADEALERAFAAIDEYAALILEHGVQPERTRFVATSASRDASNAAVFVAGVRDRLGVEPEVVSGEEEAALSFDGAVRNLRTTPPAPVLVIDIGGGSTELILGSSGPDSAGSMDIGSVRLHERHLHTDPPTVDEVAACVADIDAHLDACPVDVGAAATVVGVAGTITTVGAAVLGLTAYDRDALDQAVLPVVDVQRAVDRLVRMSVAERRALPFMHPGRADVIGAGALILSRVLARTAALSLVVSESDILDGIAWSIAGSVAGPVVGPVVGPPGV